MPHLQTMRVHLYHLFAIAYHVRPRGCEFLKEPKEIFSDQPYPTSENKLEAGGSPRRDTRENKKISRSQGRQILQGARTITHGASCVVSVNNLLEEATAELAVKEEDTPPRQLLFFSLPRRRSSMPMTVVLAGSPGTRWLRKLAESAFQTVSRTIPGTLESCLEKR